MQGRKVTGCCYYYLLLLLLILLYDYGGPCIYKTGLPPLFPALARSLICFRKNKKQRNTVEEKYTTKQRYNHLYGKKANLVSTFSLTVRKFIYLLIVAEAIVSFPC